jgi:hypothetical protein
MSATSGKYPDRGRRALRPRTRCIGWFRKDGYEVQAAENAAQP